MENVTPYEICMWAIGILLSLAVAVNTLGGAGERIAKIIQAAKSPDLDQNSRLDKLEKDMVEVKGYLASDKTHLDALDEGNRITQRALLALLSHGLDGNNVEQMEKAKQALEEHLINR